MASAVVCSLTKTITSSKQFDKGIHRIGIWAATNKVSVWMSSRTLGLPEKSSHLHTQTNTWAMKKHRRKPPLNYRVDISEEFATKYVSSLGATECKRLEALLLELDVFRSTSRCPTPSTLSDIDYCYILKNLKTSESRIEYYCYLYSREQSDKRNMINIDTIHNNGKSFVRANGEVIVKDQIVTQTAAPNQINQGLQRAPSLCVDLDFELVMAEKKLNNLGNMINEIHLRNISLKSPFNLHLAGATSDSATFKHIENRCQWINTNSYTITDKSFLDFYRKDEFIYLSPDAYKVMRPYDPSKVYIIGGLGDDGSNNNKSIAKARKEGLSAVKLPLDDYFQWNRRADKSLDIFTVFLIFSKLAEGKDWQEALSESIPSSKYKKRLY